MRKLLSITLIATLLLVLSACGNDDGSARLDKQMTKVGKVQKEIIDKTVDSAKKVVTEQVKEEVSIQVEQLTGLPADQVKQYLALAEEALLKLTTSDEPEENTISMLLIDSAKAEETEQTTEEITTEVETYTELAIEAAEEMTTPEDAEEALDLIQDTQELTVETYEDIMAESTEDESIVLENAAQETESTITDVDETLAEIDEAKENGDEDISIDIDTEVEDIIAKNPNGPLFVPVGFKTRAEMKIKKAEQRLAYAKQKLIENGVDQDKADQIISDLETRLEKAKTALVSDNPAMLREAFKNAKAVVKENRDKLKIAKKLSNNPELKEQIIEKAKELGLPEEVLSELEILKAEGKFLEAQELLSQVKKDSFIKAAKELRQENLTEKKESIQQLKEIRTKIESGELTEEEAKQEIMDLKSEQLQNLKTKRVEQKEKLAEKVATYRERFDPEVFKQKIAGGKEKLQIISDQIDPETKEEIKNMTQELNQDRKELGQEIKETQSEVKELRQDLVNAEPEEKEDLQNELKEKQKELKDEITESKNEVKEEYSEEIQAIKAKTQELRDKIQSEKQEIMNRLKDNDEDEDSQVPSKKPVPRR